jgi:hypothetical protein
MDETYGKGYTFLIRREELEIWIPPGPRLGDVVFEFKEVPRSFDDQGFCFSGMCAGPQAGGDDYTLSLDKLDQSRTIR